MRESETFGLQWKDSPSRRILILSKTLHSMRKVTIALMRGNDDQHLVKFILSFDCNFGFKPWIFVSFLAFSKRRKIGIYVCEDHMCVSWCARWWGLSLADLISLSATPPSRAVSYYQVFETLNTYGRMMRNSNEVRE